jgi:PAS domain S-box-containing protein
MDTNSSEKPSAPEGHFLHVLLEKSPDAIYFKDLESRFIIVSNQMASLFELDHPSQLIGKRDSDFFTEDHARPAFEDEQAIIRTGMPLLGKIEKETHQDNEITWATTNKFPLRDADGTIIGTFGISRDITEQKAAEERLAQAQCDLVASERRAAVSEFASAIFSNFSGKVDAIIAQTNHLANAMPAAIKLGYTTSVLTDLQELQQSVRQLQQLLKM